MSFCELCTLKSKAKPTMDRKIFHGRLPPNSRFRSYSRSLMFIVEFSAANSLAVVASVPSASRPEAEKGVLFRAIMPVVNVNSVEHEQPLTD